MKRNYAGQVIHVPMNAVAGTTSMFVTKDGSAQAAGGGGDASYVGNNLWAYTPTQAETNADEVTYTGVNDGGDVQSVTYNPIPYLDANSVGDTDPQTLPKVAIAAVGTNTITPAGTGANPAYVAES